MSGVEHSLGTPLEDMLSMIGLAKTELESILVCLGIGADRYHGVSDCSTFRAIAELTVTGGFLGSMSLLTCMPEVQAYLKASHYVQSKMPEKSIVSHYIVSSIRGKFGNYNTLERTRLVKLFVNPLMSQYYFFDLYKVLDRVQYKTFVENTTTISEFSEGLNLFRSGLAPSRSEEMPRTNQH